MDNRKVAEQYAKAAREQDLVSLGTLMHDNIVVRYPQSGEVFRGRDTYVNMLTNFAGGLGDADFESVKGSADMIITRSAQPFLAPTVTVFGGDRFVIEGLTKYPDGSVFQMISLIRIQEGRVIEDTQYYAAPFDPPEWRKEYAD